MPKPVSSTSFALRALPSVDRLLRTEVAESFRARVGPRRLTAIARRVTEELRAEIQEQKNSSELPGEHLNPENLLAKAGQRLEQACRRDLTTGLGPVINATGVILHTNLGRAPLSQAARDAVVAVSGYCTIEYDSNTGLRGRRGARVEQLLSELTGAEDGLVVNNGAAAALLVLTLLGKGGETIVSRGELVEIGGDFRVPDVMANSGTRMIEVGTTNRTRLDDYRKACSESTRLIMRVHPSNYRIIGFTAAPTLSELASLAHERGLLLYEDAGSGVLQDLSEYGLQDEPVISASLASGADIVSFSGDKLLGSAQAGLIVGRHEIVSRLRKHPLYRALRADKLRLAALESTLEAYSRDEALKQIPALMMLSSTAEQIEQRANNVLSTLTPYLSATNFALSIVKGDSAVGGGSGPNTHPPTALLALKHNILSADEIQRQLRLTSPPIIARIIDDQVLMDLRTVPVEDEPLLISALLTVFRTTYRTDRGNAG